jgi:hypothetical protein
VKSVMPYMVVGDYRIVAGAPAAPSLNDNRAP